MSCSRSTRRARDRATRSGRPPTKTKGCRRRPTAGRSTTAPRTRSTSSCPPPSTPTSPCPAAKRAPATRPSRTNASSRASTPPTTRSGRCSSPRRSASPGTPTAPSASPTSPSGTRASKAVVALGQPRRPPAPEGAEVPGGAPGSTQTIGEKRCPADPGRPHDRADHQARPGHVSGLRAAAEPNTSLPNRRASPPSRSPTPQAGVDSGEIIIRGGSHLDFSFIPNQAFGASLRGADVVAWYTIAWFDKLRQASRVRRQAAAHRALARRRRRGSGRSAPRRQRVLLLLPLAPGHPSARTAKRWDCENLRAGCPGWSRNPIRGPTPTCRSTPRPKATPGPGPAWSHPNGTRGRRGCRGARADRAEESRPGLLA